MTQAESGPQYLDQILERRLVRSALSAKDRALVTAIANGTVRMRSRLDTEIEQHYREGYATARPLLRNVLRTALFQLRYMDRIPEYAAINEAVEIARRRFGDRMSQFCNALLRNAQRTPLEWPPNEELAAARDFQSLGRSLSFPEWLMRRWIERLGAAETLALAEAFNRVPDITMRVVRPQANLQTFLNEAERAGLELRPLEGLPDFFVLPHMDQIGDFAPFKNGLCTVQDGSGGLVTYLAAPVSGESVIDLCAAPGGKAMHLAEKVAPTKVLAVDIDEARIQMLAEGAGRLDLAVETAVADACTFSATPADLVVVDAPCSGLGVLGKRSDLRWRRKQGEIAQLAQLQKRILTNAASLVRAGGRLIYSTCTTEPEENDAMVSLFMENHPEFALEPAHQFVDARFCDDKGFVRTFPHRHGIDGSFAARLKKTQ